MRRDGVTACLVSTVAVVLLSGGLVGCQRGPQVVTSIVFDGETRRITTEVVCTKQPDGTLVILVQDTPLHTVRVQLSQRERLVVHRAGLRYDDMAGFVADSREVTATKVDDTFTFSGRMPPNSGESQWHTFKIQTSCPGYVDPPAPRKAPRGAP
jgi:Mycobacterium 19 kDa lipoprotein antigen